MVRHHFQSIEGNTACAGGRWAAKTAHMLTPTRLAPSEQITYLSQTFPDPVAANAADCWAGVGGEKPSHDRFLPQASEVIRMLSTNQRP